MKFMGRKIRRTIADLIRRSNGQYYHFQIIENKSENKSFHLFFWTWSYMCERGMGEKEMRMRNKGIKWSAVPLPCF